MVLTVTLILVGFLVTLACGISLRRARPEPPCPYCRGATLRWLEARLFRGPDGRTVDVVEAGQCSQCAARIHHSHQRGWWRVTAFDGSAAAFAFAMPLSWRESRRQWRELDRVTFAVPPMCSQVERVPVFRGMGLVLGLASIIAGAVLPVDARTELEAGRAPVAVATHKSAPIVVDAPPGYAPAPAYRDPVEDLYLEATPHEEESLDVGPRPRALRGVGLNLSIDPRWRVGTPKLMDGGALVGLTRVDDDAVRSLVVGAGPAPIDIHAADSIGIEIALRSAIREARRLFPGEPGIIECVGAKRGYFCKSIEEPGFVVAGWAWAEGDRLVIAVTMMTRSMPAHMREVTAAVESIQVTL